MKEIYVDERYELVALIFRLAGRPEFCHDFNEYQRETNEQFKEFVNHPAAVCARNLQFGYDAVSLFAIRMSRNNGNFVLSDDLPGLMQCGRWTETNIAEFIALVNEFYNDTNFTAFFQKHMPIFEEHSARFERQLYSRFNKDWYAAHGLSPHGFEPIISPSDEPGGYGPSIKNAHGDIVKVCPIVSASDDYSHWLELFVHEACHSFANPIAHKWYAENEIFRKWCDDSVDTARMPFYDNGHTMAGEYVTRAYTILYMVENENADPVKLILMEKSSGFPYIAEVYAMVTNGEPIRLPADLIKYFLGMDYIMGEEEHSFNISNERENRTVRWRFIDLLGQQICVDNFSRSQVGNVFGTKTGDVIYVTDNRGVCVHIDIGPADDWSPNHRSYSVFSV